MTSRPKRTTRAPKRTASPILNAETHSISRGTKRMRNAGGSGFEDLAALIEHLVTDPKSKLTSISLIDLINEDTWYSLSLESRRSLCALLPPAFFTSYVPQVDFTHPSQPYKTSEEIITQLPNNQFSFTSISDDSTSPSFELTEDELGAGLPPTFLTDPAFHTACIAFQDHLASGWLKPSHQSKVSQFGSSVASGSSHVPWKDTAWMRDNPELHLNSSAHTRDTSFSVFTKHNLLQVGDILSYSDAFSSNEVVADVLLYNISSGTAQSSLTFILPPSSDISAKLSLPSSLVLPSTASEDPAYIDAASINLPIIQTSVHTPCELQSVILARIPKSIRAAVTLSSDPIFSLKRWKVYRWDTSFIQEIIPVLHSENVSVQDYAETLGSKGGRVCIGNLFYFAHMASRQ